MLKLFQDTNLRLRLMTAFILVIVLGLMFYHPKLTPYVDIFFVLIAVGTLWEGYHLFRRHPTLQGTRYFTAQIITSLYIGAGLWGIRMLYHYACLDFTVIMISIFMSDSGAYFIGRYFKGIKLAPRISPNKTWSGAIGGFLCVIFYTAGLYYSGLIQNQQVLYLILCCPIGQLGDLIESAVKRSCQVKDSSNLLPGHGGLLDRLDSILSIGIVWLVLI